MRNYGSHEYSWEHQSRQTPAQISSYLRELAEAMDKYIPGGTGSPVARLSLYTAFVHLARTPRGRTSD